MQKILRCLFLKNNETFLLEMKKGLGRKIGVGNLKEKWIEGGREKAGWGKEREREGEQLIFQKKWS